eukprot:3790939-Prymnesium_polylepis.1
MTCDALRELGISPALQAGLFGALAALLHLGNVTFEDGGDGRAYATQGASAAALQKAAAILEEPRLEELLIHRSLVVRGEHTRIDLSAEQAEQSMP